MLGWIIDTLTCTLELPPHRIERLHELLGQYPRQQKRVAAKAWHKLIGELRSMAMGIPGASSSFSFLQQAFKTGAKRLRLSPAMHDQLDDFRWLAEALATRPTRIAEVVPDAADYVGTYDAANPGAGGVWLPHEQWALPPNSVDTRTLPLAHPPLLWGMSYPRAVQREVVSFDNATSLRWRTLCSQRPPSTATVDFDCARSRNLNLLLDTSVRHRRPKMWSVVQATKSPIANANPLSRRNIFLIRNMADGADEAALPSPRRKRASRDLASLADTDDYGGRRKPGKRQAAIPLPVPDPSPPSPRRLHTVVARQALTESDKNKLD